MYFCYTSNVTLASPYVMNIYMKKKYKYLYYIYIYKMMLDQYYLTLRNELRLSEINRNYMQSPF